MDEENIVRRMINGDMDAFGELMEKYERPALRAAWLISGNAADSEDIVQETFTACYLNRKKLRDPAAFKTWFYTQLYVCANEAGKAFELLDVKKYKPIIGNIIYVGLEDTFKKELAL